MIFLLRVGPFGQIGRFYGSSEFKLTYGQKVVCRTTRGLEVAEYLDRDKASPSDSIDNCDGEFVRLMTTQDQLLEQRLNQNRLAAIDECQSLILQKGIPVSILDAEMTLDGRGLYFYFAGESSPELDDVTLALADVFDAKVRFSEFAEVLDKGCGPDCGTSTGGGCQSSGCTSCGLKSACKS